MLEEAGITGDVNITEYPLHFIPLEKDLLSLELDDSFSDLYLVSRQVELRMSYLLLTSHSIKTQGAYSMPRKL